MESSSMVVGADDVAEKWSGSESGWTMYIGSPNILSKSNSKSMVISDHKEGGDKMTNEKATLDCDGGGGGGGGDESDDSMASDASSGPSHYEEVIPCGNICVGSSGGGDRLRQAAKGRHGNCYKCFSGKKVGCGRVKKRDERFMIKEEKEELLLHKADSAASHV